MIFNSDISPEKEEKLLEAVRKYIKDSESYYENFTRKFDVSEMLSEDATAKLKLVVGDFVVIPVDRLKEMLDEYKH